MAGMDGREHNAVIQEQFTKQVEGFVRRHAQGNDGLLELMGECSGVGADDAVLDVACGPGIVTRFFARRARRAAGLDVVPAMLQRARQLQAEQRVSNTDWVLGESTQLPFGEGSFEGVVTRFAMHHFLEPEAVLREMKRVCKVGGAVLVADVAPSAETQDGFNQWEKLRDPSHTRALTEEEIVRLGLHAGMRLLRKESFTLEMDLETLLGGSFPNPGDADRIRVLFERDLASGDNTLGVAARRENGAVKVYYPVAVVAWEK